MSWYHDYFFCIDEVVKDMAEAKKLMKNVAEEGPGKNMEEELYGGEYMEIYQGINHFLTTAERQGELLENLTSAMNNALEYFEDKNNSETNIQYGDMHLATKLTKPYPGAKSLTTMVKKNAVIRYQGENLDFQLRTMNAMRGGSWMHWLRSGAIYFFPEGNNDDHRSKTVFYAENLRKGLNQQPYTSQDSINERVELYIQCYS